MSRRRVAPLAILLLCLQAACGLALAADNTAQPAPAQNDLIKSNRDELPPGAVSRFGSTKWRIAGGVSDVAISFDGKHVAAMGWFGQDLTVWDVAADRELYHFSAPFFITGSVVFSPDGQLLAAAFGDDLPFINIWDLRTGKQKAHLTIPITWQPEIKFSPDGKKLISGGLDTPTIVWDVVNSQKIHEYPITEGEYRFAVSPNCRWLAIADNRRSLKIINLESGRTHANLQIPKELFALFFSADSRTLALKHLNTLAQYEVATGRLRLEFPTPGLAVWFAFAPTDNKLAQLGLRGEIAWFDTLSGKNRGTWRGHRENVTAIAFSDDGRTAVSGSADGTVLVWDTRTGKILRSAKGLASFCDFLAFSADDKSILAGSSDFHILNAKTFEEQTHTPLDQSRPRHFALSSDGKLVASAQRDGKIVLIDVPTGKLLRTVRNPNWEPRSLAFGPGGDTVYGYGITILPTLDDVRGIYRRTIRVWNVTTGKELEPFFQSSDLTVSHDLKISPDGKLILAESDLRIWDLANGKEEGRIPIEATELLLAHNGNFLVTQHKQKRTQIKLLDFKNRTEILTFKEFKSQVYSWCFSHDDKILALGHANGSFTVWSIPAGKKLAELPAHRGPVTALAFSHDGETLVTGSSDGTILKWPAKAWRGK